MKTCTSCGDTKPLTEFNQDKSRKDGRKNICAVCTRKKDAAYRQKTSPPTKGDEIPAGKKRCSSCKDIKDCGMFNKNRRNKDGLQSRCQECSRRADRIAYSMKKAPPRSDSAYRDAILKLIDNHQKEFQELLRQEKLRPAGKRWYSLN